MMDTDGRAKRTARDLSCQSPAKKHAKSTNGKALKLQFLCTNDTHSQMEPFMREGYAKAIGGVARRAFVFEEMRARADVTITLDAGDFFVGQPYFDFFQGVADMTIYSALKYDASALGNHDFDASGNDLNGLPYLKDVVSKHAPNMKLLCANLVDSDGNHALEKHTIFDLTDSIGIKVGVASILGMEAWAVVSPEYKKNLCLTDPIVAAKECAKELKEAGCDVLVCLSHTGFDRGDLELANLDIFDIIFGGHAHYFNESVFHQQGSKNRLGLLSQGFAQGGGICWAQLEINNHSIINHEAGFTLLDGDAEDEKISAMVTAWKSEYTKAWKLDEILGSCSEELVIPASEDRCATCSPAHAAVQNAICQEFILGLEDSGCKPEISGRILVITNRYSVAYSIPAGPITRLDLMKQFRYNDPVLLCEISGRFLTAIIHRNALFAGQADLLYCKDVTYRMQRRDGNPTTSSLTREEIKGRALECKDIRVGGAEINNDDWYWCIMDEYVLSALLDKLPEREGGTRNTVAKVFHYRDLVEGHLRRGNTLGSLGLQ